MRGQLSLENDKSKSGWWKLGRGRIRVLGIWSSFGERPGVGVGKRKEVSLF